MQGEGEEKSVDLRSCKIPRRSTERIFGLVMGNFGERSLSGALLKVCKRGDRRKGEVPKVLMRKGISLAKKHDGYREEGPKASSKLRNLGAS